MSRDVMGRVEGGGGAGPREGVPAPSTIAAFPYYWRVRARLPERYGEPCRVLVRARMNSCLVEFADGYQVVTSRNYVRRRKAGR